MASKLFTLAAGTMCITAGAVLAPYQAAATVFTFTNGQYLISPGIYDSRALQSFINASTNTPLLVVNQGTLTFNGLPNVIQVSSDSTIVSGNSAALNFTTTAPVSFSPTGTGTAGSFFAAIDLTTTGGPGRDGTAPAFSGVSGTLTAAVADTNIVANSSLTTQSGLIAGLYAATGSQAGGSSTKSGIGGAFANFAGANNTTITNSTVTASAPNAAQGAAVVVFQTGGTGGNADESSSGGQGGATRQQTTTIVGSSLAGGGTNVSGLYLRQLGGSGGNGHDTSPRSNGGPGASGQGILLQFQPGSGSGSTVATTGANAPAIRIEAFAGNGGIGSTDSGISANGGNGGNGSALTQATLTSQTTQALSVGVFANAPLTVTTTGASAPGLLVNTRGGDGGISADLSDIGGAQSGNGGAGGSGGATLVSLQSTVRITTVGSSASAIQVLAQGGAGAQAGRSSGTFAGQSGNGGSGGAAGTVTVNLGTTVTLSTAGTNAHGIQAQSLGGYAGAAQFVSGVFSSQGGNGGNGGNSGAIAVDSAATIATSGASARGIFAQGRAGFGAPGGSAGGVTGNKPGGGGNAGLLADIAVTNRGAIATSGAGAQGILAMSLGGDGGTGGSGSGSFFAGSGAGGSSNAAGGRVAVTTTGAITTTGAVAAGILAQSVGGGGGDAGAASGVFYGSGNTGGAAGNGGAIQASLGGSIATAGPLSHGVILQSIGGSGGTGGNTTTAGVIASYAVGGTGGNGGTASTVDVTAQGVGIATTGSGADGILAQSVGGGGGAGGGAAATSGGIGVSFAAAIGGTGGAGGSGGSVTVNLGNATITTGTNRASKPVDSIGILAQSIGGGGGSGGGANALAFAVALPSPPEGLGSPSVAIAATYASGGNGTGGGSGGAVTVNLGNGANATNGGATVATSGAGSHALLAQSVGKGGGQGGDSSSMAATIGSNMLYDKQGQEGTSITLGLSVGGQGANGGSGGAVTVNTASPGAPVQISTTGDYAFGILAQSVGGGGGNAGLGSATSTYTGNNKNINLTVGVGQAGGDGSAGSTTTVNLAGGTTLATIGSGAIGVLAQSIGGGGGTATGTTIDPGSIAQVSGSKSPVSFDLAAKLTIGMTGGTGAPGGQVNVNNQGAITTAGNDSPAILAQSIGNGGGLGGSAGNDASVSGDASQPAKTAAGTLGDLAFNQNLTLRSTLGLTVGGKGGTGGNGNTVILQHGGSVTTAGDYAPGLVAQSIGGGGGRGGTASAGGEGNTVSSVIGTAIVNSNIALGASGGGGSGGSGGAVTINLDGGATIGTGGTTRRSGFQSIGVLAQSIGGGGGTGADGTVAPNGVIYLGAGLAGGGGASGDGGIVTLRQSSGGSPLTVTTTGQAAHGAVLQSIGAGGGVAGAGSTATAAAAAATIPLSVAVGLGSAGSSGNGNSVIVDNPILRTSTTGQAAVGILAQSIGAGGGVVDVTGSPVTVRNLGGGAGTGGTVTVTLPANAAIATAGAAAHGIVAQSIGGGGGMIASNVAATAPTFTTAAGTVPASTGSGSSGPVKVSNSGPITTTGAGAFGILAQSIANGGGIAALGDGRTFIGATNPNGTGAAGTVVVENAGTIRASGENAIAIYAQSLGKPGGGNVSPVTIVMGGIVQGGSGAQGAGIVVDGGTQANLITVNPGAALSALSGTAVRVTGAATNIVNNGTITGSLYQAGGGISGGGNFAAQADIQPAAANAKLFNNGTLVAPGPNTQTIIQADLVQAPSGRILTSADFAARQAGSFVVQGNAQLAGTLQTTLGAVVANVRIPVLTVTGAVTGSLVPASTALFDFAILPVDDPAGRRFDLVATGARFADSRFTLSEGRRTVASGLAAAFDAGSPNLAGFFANLDTVAADQPAEYARRLGQLGPRAAASVGARRAAGAAQIADSSMSCPVFSGATSFLTEGPCVYGRAGGRTATDGGDADRARSSIDSAIVQVGGQVEIRPGLYLGGSLAYETSHLEARGDGVKGNGNSGQAAVTLKWQTGPLLLTAAAFGTAGRFDINRLVDIPGIAAIGKGSTDLQSAGVRLRAAYTIGAEPLYIRPYLNVDGIHARMGGYREAGLGSYGLTYSDASQTAAVFTFAVEVGGRIDLGPNVLRAYASAGAALRTNSAWNVTARLQGAAPGAGGFTTSFPQDAATAHLTAGLQLFAGQRLDIRLQYEGDQGSRTATHGGAMTLAWRL